MHQIALLEKIIQMQHNIIDGHSIGSVLNNEAAALTMYTQSDVIVIAIGDSEFVNIEFTMDKQNIFSEMSRKYGLSSKHVFLNNIMQYVHNSYEGNRNYAVVTSLHNVFDGTFSKNNALKLENEMGFHEAYIFPIRSQDNHKIGFILYILNNDQIANTKSMAELTVFFEKLIGSFYNAESKTLRSRCVSIDNKMGILTEKEKEIATLILNGLQYKEIAQKLKVTINTVKTHTKNIFNKYGVCSKIELHNKLITNF